MKTTAMWGAVAALLVSSSALAQGNVPQAAAQTVQVVQSRAQNAALMKTYTWNERTEILVNGQVKDIRIDLVNFGPNGQLQRTLLNDQSAPLPGGFIRRSIAESKRKDMQKYLDGLRALLQQYTLPTPGAVMNFLDQATTTLSPNGQLVVSGTNVVQPGDALTMYLDPATKRIKRATVTTAFQGSPVNLSASFNTLPTGLNYMAYGEVTVPAKGYAIQVQNFDYVQN
ncbi:MAG TPA: hypothetical protein VMT17_09055 [Anaeromyxobacteraceae bacterium]|nr:hypothetical protein [Anaeromyxobacteraceae bacterium]